MPQILVLADTPEAHGGPTVHLREWVAPSLLDSEFYAAQLLERVRWAAEDAAEDEQRPRPASPGPVSVDPRAHA